MVGISKYFCRFVKSRFVKSRLECTIKKSCSTYFKMRAGVLDPLKLAEGN